MPRKAIAFIEVQQSKVKLNFAGAFFKYI